MAVEAEEEVRGGVRGKKKKKSRRLRWSQI